MFFVNVPVVIVVLLGAGSCCPSSKDADAPRLDPLGAVLSIVGLVAVLWAIIEAPTKGWSDARRLRAARRSAWSCIGAFVLWELTCDHPMLDVRFFKNRRFTAANIAVTLVFFAMFGQAFIGTQYLQIVLGYNAARGRHPRCCRWRSSWCSWRPLAPRLVERIGTKLVVGFGLLIVAAGLCVISHRARHRRLPAHARRHADPHGRRAWA